MKDYYRILGENIAYYRKRMHLNQAGFALRANISRGYLSQIEASKCGKAPSLALIIHMSEILGVEPYELLKEPMPDLPAKK